MKASTGWRLPARLRYRTEARDKSRRSIAAQSPAYSSGRTSPCHPNTEKAAQRISKRQPMRTQESKVVNERTTPISLVSRSLPDWRGQSCKLLLSAGGSEDFRRLTFY